MHSSTSRRFANPPSLIPRTLKFLDLSFIATTLSVFFFCRFYCAGAADNRTRLDFHGEHRIWDGRLIKQKIKGNSALYIYTDEVLSDKAVI